MGIGPLGLRFGLAAAAASAVDGLFISSSASRHTAARDACGTRASSGPRCAPGASETEENAIASIRLPDGKFRYTRDEDYDRGNYGPSDCVTVFAFLTYFTYFELQGGPAIVSVACRPATSSSSTSASS